MNALLQRGLLNIGCSLESGVCGVLDVLLETEAGEQWVLSWRRKLLSTWWIERVGGRSGGLRSGGGREGRFFLFNRLLVDALLQRGLLNIWVLYWRRGLWSTGSSRGHEGC